MNNIAGGGYPHPLPGPNERHNQERKDAHDHRKPSKRHQKPITPNPVAHEKGTCKRKHPSEQADHGQAVTSKLRVRVDELPSMSAFHYERPEASNELT